MSALKTGRDSAPSGLILFNKKEGVTSFEALGEIKRCLGTGKVGHTGTLDKFASGLMLVLTGRALKLSQWFSHCGKQYSGRIRFGIETDTLDPEGRAVAEAPPPSREQVERALLQFTGDIMQVPPVYSALHVNSKRASALARSGQSPVMKERPVRIHKLELRLWEPPFAEIFVHCSSGTYIRSLARDIALAAGSRAHLCSLVRTSVAGFSLEDAISSAPCEGKNILRSIDQSVFESLGLPRIEVDPDEAQRIIFGKPLSPILDKKPLLPQREDGSLSAAVFSGGIFIAIVEKVGDIWQYGCVYSSSNDLNYTIIKEIQNEWSIS